MFFFSYSRIRGKQIVLEVENNEIFTGVHPSLQVLTVASKTKKFDSGILNALNLASKPSPSRDLSSAGNTKLSTGHLK